MSSVAEHEITTFIHDIQRNIDLATLSNGTIVKNDGSLCRILNKLSGVCINVSTVCTNTVYRYSPLFVGGVDMGDWADPYISRILSMRTSPASPPWITDLAYNRTRDFPSSILQFEGPLQSLSGVLYGSHIDDRLALRPHKLAVHLEGGQSDWQLDTENWIHPVVDRVHAVILVALNTSWEGGGLVLRRRGRELEVDLHPFSEWSDPTCTDVDLQAVALYPDTQYKVEPVTKGVRMVLHFDVVSAEPSAEGGSHQPEVYDYANIYDEEEEYDDMSTQYSESFLLSKVGQSQPTSIPFQTFSPEYAPTASDLHLVGRAIALIRDRLQKVHSYGHHHPEPTQVAFALQYPYLKKTLLPQHLHGCDALLYQSLTQTNEFDVSLRPVILAQFLDDDQDTEYDDVYAYLYDGRNRTDEDADKPPKNAVFHLNNTSSLTFIQSRPFSIEEDEPGHCLYSACGIFVMLRTS